MPIDPRSQDPLSPPSPQGEKKLRPSPQEEGDYRRSLSLRGERQSEGGLCRDSAKSGQGLEQWIKRRALSEGFDSAGIAAPGAVIEAGAALHAFLEAGFNGEMEWLADKADRRADPGVLWPEVRSVVMLGMTYGPKKDPLAALSERGRAVISVYAQGLDYHDVIKSKLKAVARDFSAFSGADVKVFVDTAPVMEKPLAQAAGIGWQGKHTNLVSRQFGSWLFLGAIFTTALLKPDAPEGDHCGTCRACINICPTQAFPAPRRLDARRCISYLTIEHKGQIPLEFREPIGNRIYGCDDCLAVCPWNKFAREAREARFASLAGADNPPVSDLLALDDAGFRARFRGSPIKRTGRDRFVRNVLVAAGNSGDAALLDGVLALLGDASPLVRGMAVWAARKLGPVELVAALKTKHYPEEREAGVLAEWDCDL
ncbi:MAG: tRNA epoxyqueuosine(34) reductase QueG [Rhodomicrobium sp.]